MALAGASIVLLAAYVADGYYARSAELRRQSDVRAAAAPYANAITIAVARRIATLQGLAAMVRLHHGDRNFLSAFAAYGGDVVANSSGIRTVQLVQDGIIVTTAPREGNEQAVGFDLRQHPDSAVWNDYLRAATSHAVVLSGPIELIQGGPGVVGRLAVHDEQGRLIGVVAVVMDIPPLLREAGLGRTPGLTVTLIDHRGNALAGPDSLVRTAAVRLPVALPDRRWQLLADGAMPAVVVTSERWALRGAAVGIALLLATLLLTTASRQAALRRAVLDATQSLRATNRELAAEMRRRDTAERQLHRAQRMEGLGRLAGGVAHDFNNLLTGMLGYVGLLKEDLPDDHQSQTDLEQIERATRQAAVLTRQLLTFARRQPTAARIVNLNVLIQDAHGMLTQLAGKAVDVRLDLSPDECIVEVDPAQAEQVLTNLVVNARDAMPDGGTIAIATDADADAPDDPGDADDDVRFVALSVSDSGCGIEADTLEHIFEPFFTTKPEGQGTGLGLSICYGIAKRAGGHMLVSSTPGNGATFTLLLPAAVETSVASSSPADPVTPDTPGHGTVVVADDDISVRGFVTRALQRRGYSVEVAGDGETALALVTGRAGGVDVLIADVQMAGKDGLTLADDTRQLSPRTRVLLISGNCEESALDSVLAPGAVAFLAKPFSASELADALARLLGHR